MGWLNCTPTSFAMGIDKSSLGAKRPSGCDIRRYTGDLSEGTTLWQCRTATETHYGIKVEVRAGSNVCTPSWAAVQIQAGRGYVLQGNTGALIGTIYRSTGGGVNHAVWVNDVRGGTVGNPSQALVYDPAADGRKAGWGTAAQGPQWWPINVLLRFAAALRPYGDSRTLGPGKLYAAFFPDTEPHAHLYSGARRTAPFPDHQTIKSPDAGRVNVRKTPDKRYAPIKTLANGTPWIAYQYKPDGAPDNGTRGWYGNHDGNQWVHESGLIGEGGTT